MENFGVKRRKKDNVNTMLRRFKKLTTESGVLEEVKSRRYYLKPSEIKYKQRKSVIYKQKLDNDKKDQYIIVSLFVIIVLYE